MRRIYILLAALLGAGAAQAAPAPLAIPPLMTAKTIQVSERQVVHADGKPDAVSVLNVKIERPDKTRIEETDFSAAGPADGTLAALFVSNGKTQHEYTSFPGIWYTDAPIPPGEGVLSAHFNFATVAQLPLLLGRSRLAYTLAGTDTIQGRTQRLYESGVQAGDPPAMQKIWVDAQTHLPTRRIAYVQTDGQMVEAERSDFSNWTLNAPIPADTFAWMPPVGAKEYAAPVRPAPLGAGTAAPDFTVQDKDGRPVKLSDFRGKTVLLDFWATWCPPCQRALPHTAALARQYQGKGVVVLGVNVWDKSGPFAAWLPQHPDYNAIRFVIDPTPSPGDVASRLYHVWGIPTQYVIDPSGKVLLGHVYDGTDDAVDAALQKAAGRS